MSDQVPVISPHRTDAMRLVVTGTAEPEKIGIDVISSLAPKNFVMNVNSGTQLAQLTWLTEVLEPE